MAGELERKRTLYTKDVLPARVTRHINKNEIDIKSMIADQIVTVDNLQVKLLDLRKRLVSAIDFTLSSDNSMDVVDLGEAFTEGLLNDIIKQEMKIRSLLLGKQECVEMFKGAVLEKEVSSAHLEAARMDRDGHTAKLSTIVEGREAVFSALETIQRMAVDCTENSDSVLGKLKREYTCLESTLENENDKLKMFTEWQRNPEAMRRGLKKLGGSLPNLLYLNNRDANNT